MRRPGDDETPTESTTFADRDSDAEVFVADAEASSAGRSAPIEPSWRLVALVGAGAIGLTVVALLVGLLATDRDRDLGADAAAAAPEAETETGAWSYLVGAVVTTGPTASGRVLQVDDRCEVDVRRCGPATCDLFVVCPGAERRFHDAPCRVDDEGALTVDADGARFDGRTASVEIEGATIRLDDGPR